MKNLWPTSIRTIERTARFRRDYKRETKTYGKTDLEDVFISALQLLIADAMLPEKFADHPMAGEWKDYRDCHIKPDLILIYRKPDNDTLRLVRLGSHAELGL
ncbi:MAG: type II toxin-antitoxin system YafQ family toxin [Desulfovibrio sp.]|nr:type II toxin-antitoxin system YafQ family toxin [Desulfovibrio sp.]